MTFECGYSWPSDGGHEHRCTRTPGHAVLFGDDGGRFDHWCFCGAKHLPQDVQP